MNPDSPETETSSEVTAAGISSGGETVPRAGFRKPLIVLLVSLAVLVALHAGPWSPGMMEMWAWQERFDRRGIKEELAFAAIAALLIAVGVPRLALFGIAGFLFGFAEGLAVAMVAGVAGSWLCFAVVRWGFREWAVQRFGERRLFRHVTTAGSRVGSVFLIRQLPLSNAMVNAGLALTGIRTTTFLAGSFLGFLPNGAVATLIGGGIAEDHAWQGVVQLAAAAAILYFLGAAGLRRLGARRRTEDSK